MDQQMTNKCDYFRFKSLVFYGLILGILTAIFGITFFRDQYYIYSVICICYSAVKFAQMVIIQGYVNFKFSQALDLFNERKKNNIQVNLKEITHVFIIPSFNQDLDILRQTLSNLANHSQAKNYCVFLAMQKHEINCEKKAQILVNQYQNIFRLISYTVHELQPNQAKGKPGNINWCARHMPQKLKQKFVNLDSVMITIMDADSLAPEPYIGLVDQHVQRNYQNKQKYIYQAPQIFYRNNNQSAFFVDIIDNFMSYMQCSQFVSMLGFTMGVSNYTISYKLLQKIQFWDTCKYSKCQDVRTPCKAFWKTNGWTQTVPIYIPFNQLNLKTGRGYWADFIARITQAKRHSQAQIELSYNLANFLQNPKGNVLKKLNICYIMFQLYFIILVVFPTSLAVLLLQQSLHIIPMSSLDPGYTLHISNFINTFLLVIGLSLFEYFKRKAARQVYGINKSFNIFKFLRIFPIYFPLAMIFGYFPSVVASYHLHNDNIMFNVTPKAIQKDSQGKEKERDINIHVNMNMDMDMDMDMDMNMNQEQGSIIIDQQPLPKNSILKNIASQDVDHSCQVVVKAVDEKV